MVPRKGPIIFTTLILIEWTNLRYVKQIKVVGPLLSWSCEFIFVAFVEMVRREVIVLFTPFDLDLGRWVA